MYGVRFQRMGVLGQYMASLRIISRKSPSVKGQCQLSISFSDTAAWNISPPEEN